MRFALEQDGSIIQFKANEELKRRLQEGVAKIRLAYVNGEHLSGYKTQGYAAHLLKQERVARDIMGWGTLVDNALVEALGEEFTFLEVLEYVKDRKKKKRSATGNFLE